MDHNKTNTFTNMTGRLVDKCYRTLALSAFFGLGAVQSAAEAVQRHKRRIFTWLRRRHGADTEAVHGHYSDESFWRETIRRLEALPALTFSSPGPVTR